MPLITVNAIGPTVRPLPDAPPLHQQLGGTLTDSGPVIVMIHGYRFTPDVPFSNPHSHILALEPRQDCWKAISWPRHLGCGRVKGDGLAIGFGWNACGSIRAAYAEAERAGEALAGLITQIHHLVPGRRVEVVAHSLGARVALCAMTHLPAHSLGRVILLAGAEFGPRAAAALATPAGTTAEVLNITTRENDLFDAALEWLVPPGPFSGFGRGLGHGLPHPVRNWLDIQVDQPATLAALASLGHRIAPPHLRVCHWSAYLRPGLFALYRALLTEPQSLPLPMLRACLPHSPDPRWSRLFAAPTFRLPLPSLRNASS